jgi:preprotein translocase subunit SecF
MVFVFSSCSCCEHCVITNKLDQGVDFVGGRTFQVRFEKPVEAGIVKKNLLCLVVLKQIFGNDNQLKITTNIERTRYRG